MLDFELINVTLEDLYDAEIELIRAESKDIHSERAREKIRNAIDRIRNERKK